MSINTFLLLLLVIANYTNLFLNLKNRRRWNFYYFQYRSLLKKLSIVIYNTGAYSANTMVRAFLTEIGESYLNNSFNTGSGKGKEIWQHIKVKFENKCAFLEKNLVNLLLST